MIIWPTANETEILAVLFVNGGETMTKDEVVHGIQALVKPVSMRGVLERMERKGLISRIEPDEIELTELGRRIAELWTEFGGGPAGY